MGTFFTSAKRRKSLVISGVAVVAAAGVAAAVIPAVADSGNQSNGSAKGKGANHAQHGGQSIEVQSGLAGGSGSGGTILAASLNGANEVPIQDGPAVGDKDGAALQFVKVKGDKVSVAVKWRGTGQPRGHPFGWG